MERSIFFDDLLLFRGDWRVIDKLLLKLAHFPLAYDTQAGSHLYQAGGLIRTGIGFLFIRHCGTVTFLFGLFGQMLYIAADGLEGLVADGVFQLAGILGGGFGADTHADQQSGQQSVPRVNFLGDLQTAVG